MKMSMKAAAVTVACLTLLGGLSGCSGSKKASSSTSAGSSASSSSTPHEKVTLTFWHTYSDTEVKVFTNKVIPDFEAKNPDITIKSVTMPTSNLEQQVIQAAAGKAAPDVMRMDITWIPQLASLGALQELSSYSGFDTVKQNSFASALTTCQWNGKYYGVPLDTNTKVAIYNTADLKAAGLTEAPATFDDLLAAAKKLKATHPNGLIGLGGTSVWAMAPYFLSLGGQYCNTDYTKASGYINSPQSVAALQKLLDAYNDGLIGKCILNGQPGTWDGLKAANGYAMIDDGPWFYSIQDKSVTSKDTIAQMPSGSAGSISVVGGEDLVMFANGKHKDAAWTFMNYLAASEFPQKTMALDSDCLPTYLPVANLSDITSDPVMKVYIEQTKTAWARIPNAHFSKMDDDISKGFEKVFRHQGTPQAVLDDLAKQLDALFADTNPYTAS